MDVLKSGFSRCFFCCLSLKGNVKKSIDLYSAAVESIYTVQLWKKEKMSSTNEMG